MALNPDYWHGWQVHGRHLVTPGRQRVTADTLEQLIGMHHTRLHFERVGLQAQAAAAKRRRQERVRQVVKVVVVDLADWRARHELDAG